MSISDINSFVRSTAALLPERRRWTREEFERAGEMGVFGPEERLELIAGEVIRKVTPQKTPHATSIMLAADVLRSIVGADVHVRVQLPLVLDLESEPEPDIAVVSGGPRDYEVEHPATALLVVEVSDTTLALDRAIKGGLYAKAGLQEYWIVNLRDHVLEVLREPGPMVDQPFGWHYLSVTRYTESQSIVSLIAPDTPVRVADLLPRRPIP